jgi:hypothetical protein
MTAKDIVATIGTYQKDGETKYVTRKVGQMVETKHGPRIKLDASFNPAGCRRDEDGAVWLAIFDQRERDEPQRGGGPVQQRGEAPKPARGTPAQAESFEDDEIPFITNRGKW